MSQNGPQGAQLGAETSEVAPVRKRPAPTGLVARISLAAFTVGIGLAVFFAILFLAIISLRDRSLEARNSQQVIASANRLQTLVVELESGVRGFFISGEKKDLAPWKEAQRNFPGAAATLLSLTKDNALQHQRAMAIKGQVEDYLTTFSRPLVYFMRRNPPAARQFITDPRGPGRSRRFARASAAC